MKKALSLILVLALCLCLCACNETTFGGEPKTIGTTFSGEPKTIVLNDENFRDYFLVYGEVEAFKLDKTVLGDDIVNHVVIKIIPQFEGTWEELSFDMAWEMTGTAGDTSIRGYTNTANLNIPVEQTGGVACELTMSSWVDSLPFNPSSDIGTLYLNGDIFVDVDIQSIENVSDTITVSG